MTRRPTTGPVEGWLSLALVAVICLTMALAIDDVAPVIGRGAYTDFLVWAALGGVLVGFIGPNVGWGRWRTYLIGSLFAALIVPLLVGAVILVDQGSPWERYKATADSVVNAFYDLVLHGSSFTLEFGHHMLVFGLFVWATSMFASYATFGHRRPLNGIVLVGVVLVVNMSLTINDQLGYLIVYTLASLFLLIRSHALEEQAEWLRRRIGDPSAISGIYLRGGSLFIAMAVVGSLLLTQAASSKPLAGAWDGVSEQVVAFSRTFAKFLPGGPSAKNLGSEFGDDTQIRGFWPGGTGTAVTIQLPPGAPRDLYWRAVTYDHYDLSGWHTSTPAETTIESGQPLLAGSLDIPTEQVATTKIVYTVTPAEYSGSSILAPQWPQSVDQTTSVKTVGQGGYFVGLRRGASDSPYQVTAVVPVADPAVPDALTENRLRVAGTQYPQEVKSLYLDVPAGAMVTPQAQDLYDAFLAAAGGPGTDPYDIALTMQGEFRDPANFTYDTNVQDLQCDVQRLSSVDCFAVYKKGYCQYYASAMAIFLRKAGIPARVVDGYLPGDRDLHTNQETLLAKDKHEWVEAYFPGYGWVPFDPTGGGVAELQPLPAGAPVASASPHASSSGGPASSARATKGPTDKEPPGTGGAGTTSGKGPGAGLLGAVAVLLAVVFSALAFVVWRRGPRGQTSPDRAYGTVTRLASRLGYGPRPTQTVYEYAGALGDVLPDAKPALELVARAKVESAYGRAVFDSSRLVALREAERRLRVSLLRLLFRRGRRPF